MAVGSKLKQLINKSGYSQKQVAEMAGIKPQTLNNIIIRDSARTDIQNLIKICKALSIDISVFADDAIEEFYQEHPNVKKEDNLKLSSHENKVIKAYRNKPDMQPVVDKILDVNKEEKTYTRFVAARSENGQSSMRIEEASKEAHDDLANAPETDMDF